MSNELKPKIEVGCVCWISTNLTLICSIVNTKNCYNLSLTVLSTEKTQVDETKDAQNRAN